MKQYLDADGLNRYHTSLKDDMSLNSTIKSLGNFSTISFKTPILNSDISNNYIQTIIKI